MSEERGTREDEVNTCRSKGIGFGDVFNASLLAGLLAVVPQIIINKYELGGKIDELRPKIFSEQVIGDSTPEKFYKIDGERVYLEIDGQPVEQYFASRR